MSSQATYVGEQKIRAAASDFSAAGYVKCVITYMIMDDLEVEPMSTISSITLLNRFNVKDVGALEEKVVELGMNQVSIESSAYYLLTLILQEFYVLINSN